MNALWIRSVPHDHHFFEAVAKSRLKVLPKYFAEIDDLCDPWQVAHPLPEVLLLVVCGTICDRDEYDAIVEWGAARHDFQRRCLPFHHGVPGRRWLTILMNRINPALFAAAFISWLYASWSDMPDFIAFDGNISTMATAAPN